MQEQGARHRFAEGETTQSLPSEPLTEISVTSEEDGDTVVLPPPPPLGLELESCDQHFGRHAIAAGGLAGAIAALAERQAVGGDTAAPATTVQTTCPEDYRATEVSNEETLETTTGTESESRRQSPVEDTTSSSRTDLPVMASISGRGEEDAENSSRASEKLANWVSSTQKEYKGSNMNTWLGDQSSEQVEVGTSFSSSVPSASELPWEAPDVPSEGRNGESSGSGGGNNEKVLMPDSFEEQMMLAMALSLADAQARVPHGGNRSGPLPQVTNPIAEAQPRVRQGNSRSGPLPRPTYIGH